MNRYCPDTIQLPVDLYAADGCPCGNTKPTCRFLGTLKRWMLERYDEKFKRWGHFPIEMKLMVATVEHVRENGVFQHSVIVGDIWFRLVPLGDTEPAGWHFDIFKFVSQWEGISLQNMRADPSV